MAIGMNIVFSMNFNMSINFGRSTYPQKNTPLKKKSQGKPMVDRGDWLTSYNQEFTWLQLCTVLMLDLLPQKPIGQFSSEVSRSTLARVYPKTMARAELKTTLTKQVNSPSYISNDIVYVITKYVILCATCNLYILSSLELFLFSTCLYHRFWEKKQPRHFSPARWGPRSLL